MTSTFSQQFNEIFSCLFRQWNIPQGQQTWQQLKQLAEQGDANGQCLLAWCYHLKWILSSPVWDGFGFPADQRQAEDYLRRSLAQDCLLAKATALVWHLLPDEEYQALQADTGWQQQLLQQAQQGVEIYQYLAATLYELQILLPDNANNETSTEEAGFASALYWYQQALQKQFYPAIASIFSLYFNYGRHHNQPEQEIQQLFNALLPDSHPMVFYYYALWLRLLDRQDEAIDYYKQAADLGDKYACYITGKQLAEHNKTNEALWYYKLAANHSQHCEPCIAAGDILQQQENDSAAFHYYSLARERGSIYASYLLGECYYTGRGVEFDIDQAVKYYTDAAQENIGLAQFCLACIYFFGYPDYLQQDDQQAVYWLLRADENDYQGVHPLLGHCYLHGIVVRQNYATAWQYLHRAEEVHERYGDMLKGLLYNALGKMYADGLFIKKDVDKAAGYFQQAQCCGNESASEHLTHFTKSRFGRWTQNDEVRFIEPQSYTATEPPAGYLTETAQQAFHLLWGYNWDADEAQRGKALLEQAAAKGDADALCLLARCYMGKYYIHEDFGFAEDDDKATELLKQSIRQGSAGAVLCAMRYLRAVGFDYDDIANMMPFNSFSEAFDIVLNAARQGDVFSQFTIANAYYWGDLLAIKGEIEIKRYFPDANDYWAYSYSQAGKWYERSFCNGMRRLYENYQDIYNTDGYLPNIQRLEYWFRFFADRGCFILQTCYARLLFEQGNIEQAIHYSDLAWQQGYKESYVWLGGLLVDKNNLSLAEKYLDQALAAGCKAVYCNYGILKIRQGDHVQAEEYLQKAVAEGNNSANFWLGEIKQTQGKTNAAILFFQKAMNNDNGEACNRLGQIMAEQGDIDQAKKYYQQGIEMGSEYACCNYARLMEQQEQTDYAIKLYQHAIHMGHQYSCQRLSELMSKLGRSEEAISFLQQYADGVNAFACRCVGDLQQQTGAIDAAITSYKQALTLGDNEAGNKLYQLMTQQNQSAALLAFLQELADQGHNIAYSHLGYLLEQQGNFEQAITYYKQAVEWNKEDNILWLHIGYNFSCLQQTEEAIYYYQQAANLGNTTAFYNLGIIKSKQKKPDEAEALYKEAIRHGYDEADVNNNLGVILFNKGDYTGAEYYYKKAIQCEDNLPVAIFNLGYLYSQTNKTTEAIYYLKQAVENNVAKAGYELGKLLQKLKKPDEAAYYYKAELNNGGAYVSACCANCCAELTKLYFYGYGIKKDLQQARQYAEQGAALNNSTCQSYLGYLYFTGEGCDQDYQRAVELLLKSVAGDKPELFSYPVLGQCYYYGIQVPQDSAKAAMYILKAFIQNNKDFGFYTFEIRGIIFNGLGELYTDGVYIPQDIQLAVKYFKKARRRGSEYAKQNMHRFVKQGFFGKWQKKPTE